MRADDKQFCGFDFGTSNSAVGQFVGGQPVVRAVEGEQTSIPTALFFSFADGEVLFGKAAIEAYTMGEDGRLLRSLKSVLGSALMRETTQIQYRRLSFEEIIAVFIESVRAGIGHPRSVVMGRPVYFVDDDPDADREAERQLEAAARLAGFEHIAFQYEPIAAAMDYERSVTQEQLVFVADIGGGTSDFSIVRVSPERRNAGDRQSDILAFSGVHVGGTDFDRLTSLASVMPHLGYKTLVGEKNIETPIWWYQDLSTWHRIPYMYERRIIDDIKRVRREAHAPGKLDVLLDVLQGRSGHGLLARIEAAKIALADETASAISIPRQASNLTIDITKTDFEQAIEQAVGRIEVQARQTVAEAQLKSEAIHAVFLTGGSSRLPVLGQVFEAIFPNSKRVDGDAFGSVSMGLTLEARHRFG